jgi:LPXTG-motif cell wall-anchored protein
MKKVGISGAVVGVLMVGGAISLYFKKKRRAGVK